MSSITEIVQQAARDAGFELAGIAPVHDFEELNYFPEWVEAGRAGEMKYLEARDEAGNLKRASLRSAVPWARSVIVCAINYNTAQPYSTQVHDSDRGWISRYAWSREDYHDAVLRRLRLVEAKLQETFQVRASGAEAPQDDAASIAALKRCAPQNMHGDGALITRCYVDTGPLVERVYAKYAGVGWIGKNTCIINQKMGSWLFLGVILTSLEVALPDASSQQPVARQVSSPDMTLPLVRLPDMGARGSASNDAALPEGISTGAASSRSDDAEAQAFQFEGDLPAPDRCGTCTRCIDACPTDAIVAPYQLDSNLCIAYLTIEKRGEIPVDMREGIGRHVFGCDICQDVCPWNRKAPPTAAAEFEAHEELVNPALEWLAKISVEEFRETFRGSPIRRAKRTGLRRNAVIAIGNSGRCEFVPLLEELAADGDPIVASSAGWALARLRGEPESDVMG